MAAENSTESAFWGAGEHKKRCTKCGQAKPLSEFYKHWSRRLGRFRHASRCIPCIGIHRTMLRKKNKGKALRLERRATLKRKYGLSDIVYNAMYEAQKGLCAICGNPQKLKAPLRCENRMLAVDHDHVTGKIRALLCQTCNWGLGAFKESPDLLRKAISYLETHKRNSN